jgi:hypothetical protein
MPKTVRAIVLAALITAIGGTAAAVTVDHDVSRSATATPQRVVVGAVPMSLPCMAC